MLLVRVVVATICLVGTVTTIGAMMNELRLHGHGHFAHTHQAAMGRSNLSPTQHQYPYATERFSYVPGRAVRTALHRMFSVGVPSNANTPFTPPLLRQYGRGVDKVPQMLAVSPRAPTPPPAQFATRMDAAIALSQQIRLLQERKILPATLGEWQTAGKLPAHMTSSYSTVDQSHRPAPSRLATSTMPSVSTAPSTTQPSETPNYCDEAQYPATELGILQLKRLDRFIFNHSCSPLFFQCSQQHTFPLQCPDPDNQAFDPLTSGCNFRNSVRFCPGYDHILHCTVREFCSANEFACCAHPQRCLDLQRRCDGHPDCSDGDDENNCPSCARNEFACVKSGRCLDAKKRCDRVVDDCGDGSNSDELGCSKAGTCWGKFVCDSRATLNSAGHSVCIEREKFCDGRRDCPGGEDELNHCSAIELKYLTCENQKQSVRREEWCNGREECLDGSDEKYCF